MRKTAKRPSFTIGIEEEFQIVDPQTRELRSHIQEILAGGKVILKEHVKPEMHQSMVELGTEICDDTHCAREQIVLLRSELAALAARWAEDRIGRHPSFHWKAQENTADERYLTIVNDISRSPASTSSLGCTSWEQTGGDLEAVVDQIIAETYEGLSLPSRPNDRRRPRMSPA